MTSLSVPTSKPAASNIEPELSSPTFTFILADYNPTVLQLVTLPNFLLSWALQNQTLPSVRDVLDPEEGELEITPELMVAFQHCLEEYKIKLKFMSGGWSSDFLNLLDTLSCVEGSQDLNTAERAPSLDPSGVINSPEKNQRTLILGAETIYSPFALQAFTEIIFSILEKHKSQPTTEANENSKPPAQETIALVAAKRLYFGVGGSLDDFVDKAKERGGLITQLREETDGVRRGVVSCSL